MNLKLFLLSLLASSFSLTATAAVKSEDLPKDTVWYMHANFEQMRTSESGSPIYDWFDDEVIEEVGEEIGVDLNDEVNSVTAFSDEQLGTVIVVEGPLRKDFRSQVMAALRMDAELQDFKFDGKAYHFAGDDEEADSRNEDPFDDLENGVFFSFAVKNKLIVASHEEQMKALLESGGKIAGSGSVDDAMFVLTADKSFVQAGLRPEGMADDEDDDWESNIIRNTEQAALLISDSDGRIAFEAQLVSVDPKMAESIGGIVNGLISLQAFNSELGPELQSLLQNTRVRVDENLLSISTVIEPELVIEIVSD